MDFEKYFAKTITQNIKNSALNHKICQHASIIIMVILYIYIYHIIFIQYLSLSLSFKKKNILSNCQHFANFKFQVY